MISGLYGQTDILKLALDGTETRYKAITNNIANVNTPEYKRITVDFESELKKVTSNNNQELYLSKTHENHMGKSKSSIENFKPTIKVQENTSVRKDKNNVNPDTEAIDMAKTTIMYNALINQISRKFEGIQNVIREGGK